jgi:PiT family inorganic phosphate transporter
VRWGVAKNIVMGWFITMPAAGCAAALVYGVIHLVFG